MRNGTGKVSRRIDRLARRIAKSECDVCHGSPTIHVISHVWKYHRLRELTCAPARCVCGSPIEYNYIVNIYSPDGVGLRDAFHLARHVVCGPPGLVSLAVHHERGTYTRNGVFELDT